MLSLALLMSAVDGWIPTLFEEEKKPIGSYGRFIGFGLGAFLAYNIFLLLNSKKWCKDFLNIDEPPLKSAFFLKCVAAYCVVTSILIIVFVSERVERKAKILKFSHITKAFKQIIKKPMTRKWIFVCMLKSFGVDGIVQIISTVLVKEDLNKEVLVMANTMACLPILLGTLVILKCLKKGKIMNSIYWLIWSGVFMAMLDVYTYYDFKKNGDKNTLWFSMASACLGGWMKCALWIFDTGQLSIMCDESLNVTHFATMQVLYNIANSAPYIIGVFLIGFIDFYIWAAFCLVYNVIF